MIRVGGTASHWCEVQRACVPLRTAAMAQPEPDYPGDVCKSCGLTSKLLLAVLRSGENASLPQIGEVKNELVLELASFMDARQPLWSAFVAWLASLSGKDVSALSEQAVSLKVQRLKKARRKLVKSCSRPEQRDELSSLMSQQFILVEKVNTESGPGLGEENASSSKEIDAITMSVRKEIIGELQAVLGEIREKYMQERERCQQLEEDTGAWRNKVRNIRKKLARCDDKLSDFLSKLSVWTQPRLKVIKGKSFERRLKALKNLLKL